MQVSAWIHFELEQRARGATLEAKRGSNIRSRDTVYVGLTRHKMDAFVIAERDRLQSTPLKRELDSHKALAEITVREKLFGEARSYAEEVNVVDFVEDRIEFARTGQIQIRLDPEALNLGRVALAVRGIFETTREISTGASHAVPVWRLVDSARHIRREIANCVAEIIETIRGRIDLRTKARSVAREWDAGR